jgi:hypothetical protein
METHHSTAISRAMNILRRLQLWQITPPQKPLPIRGALFRQIWTAPEVKGEIEIGAVVAGEAEAEEGSKGVEERDSAQRTMGNVRRSAIWAGANGSMQSESLFSCLTN